MSVPWIKYLPDFLRNRLESRQNLQKILTNTVWLFAERILRMGFGLVVGVWVARYLGPEQFGLFSYVLAFVALFGVFATLGLDDIVVRDIVRNPSDKDEILGATFSLKLLGGLVGILLTTAGILLLRPNDRLTHSMVAIIASGLIFQSFDTISFWFQSQVQIKYVVYAKNGAFILIALAKVGLILSHASLIAFAWAALAEIILGAVGLTLAYGANGHLVRAWRGSIARARSLLTDSWPLILAGLAIVVYMKIDQIMLGEMLGNQAVGLYSAATRISEIWYFIPVAIVSSASPSIVEAKAISDSLYYQKVDKLFRLMAVLAFSIVIPMTFFSGHIIDLLYGPEFAGAGSVLAIHIWAAVFVFLGVAQGPWTVNEGLMKLSLQRTVIGAVANVVLNLLLIPRIGVVGAAISTLIAQALSSCILNRFDRRTRRIFTLQMRALVVWRDIR